MENRTSYLLKVTPDKNHVTPPRLPEDLPALERLKLVNAWRGAMLKNAADQTKRVARELGRMIDGSPFKGEARVKTAFENIRVIEVELNDAKSELILALLNSHPEIKPYPMDLQGKPPVP